MKQTPNPDSAYADDDVDSLSAATYEEQRGRYAAIVALKKAVEGSPSFPKADELGKELRSLEQIYESQWAELASALGWAVAAKIRQHAEAAARQSIEGRVGEVTQLRLPL